MADDGKRQYTVQDYKAFELHAADRHEYLDGEIFAMTRGSHAHNTIGVNFIIALGGQLTGKPCRPFGSDTRVKVSATGLYTYPDFSVACEPQFEMATLETLLNPKVLVEVLSPSTVDYDRNTKLSHYQQIASVEEVLLVAQDAYWVEQHTRQAEGNWVRRLWQQSNVVVDLPGIGCQLTLAQIYDQVVFLEAETP